MRQQQQRRGAIQGGTGEVPWNQVIPIVSGWFGKINEDVDKVIKVVAWQAAAGEDGMATSPSANTDRKGGAYLIMLQQFRRAI